MKRTSVLLLILSLVILAGLGVQAAVPIHGLDPQALKVFKSSELCLSGEAPQANNVSYELKKDKTSYSHPFYRPPVDKYFVRRPIFRPGIDKFTIRTVDNVFGPSVPDMLKGIYRRMKQNATY